MRFSYREIEFREPREFAAFGLKFNRNKAV